jgi:tyrosyl-tRNA synthetase
VAFWDVLLLSYTFEEILKKKDCSMTLSEELQWRGFVNQTTFKDIKEVDNKKRTFYLGFDASAPSQAIGNLAIMMMAHAFLRHGYKGVILAGGATSLIGDPGGKDAERVMQSDEAVAKNVANANQQLKSIFQGQHVDFVNNLDWTKNMSVIDFLRDVGKHFSMTQLVGRDYIAKRMGEGGSGISYAEFSYTLLQGMDYLHLFRKHGVTLQLAGSDQWGNSVSGVDLIRKVEEEEVDVWTAPLVINKATGKKFGKSEGGAVWLDPKMTSVYKFYQFWLNSDDEGAIDYLKIYTTLLSKEKIDELENVTKEHPEAREAQKTLAFEVTKLVHGQARAESVRRVTDVLFGKSQITDLRKEDLEALSHEIPTVKAGKSVVDALVSSGVVGSNSEARRLLSAGAITVNGEKIAEDQAVKGVALIKKGKNAFVLAR